MIQASDGNLYGTTFNGGAHGAGTVFKITTGGTYTLLYSFGASSGDGSFPSAALAEAGDGNLYGTTGQGGANGGGTVFRISKGGTYSSLLSFANSGSAPSAPGGADPAGALTVGTDGRLYGLTANGGAYGRGIAYAISTSGTQSVLYSFAACPSDGQTPVGQLTLGPDGNFYGETQIAGSHDSGTVFGMTPSGIVEVLHYFSGTSLLGIQGQLLIGADGNLYGVTGQGGSNDHGTAFTVSPDGTFTELYSFGASSSDGVDPQGALVQGSDGAFYGVTGVGGASGTGTVYKLVVSGAPAAGIPHLNPTCATASSDSGGDIDLRWLLFCLVGWLVRYYVLEKGRLKLIRNSPR